MNREQIIKILDVMILATVIMFGFELLFSFDVVTNWISNLIFNSQDWIVYLVIWLLMFIQVCFIPIPAYIVLNACVIIPSINLGLNTSTGWLMIAIILSAYILGAVVAYWIGRKWGIKAIKWCAGSNTDYDKWANFINNKGKWWYALTILLPIFPDDLLVLVAGSIKLDFKFFFWSNLIGRFIGLVCMIGTLQIFHLGNGGGIPWSLIGWGIVLVILVLTIIVLKIRGNKDK